ncbi:hypothetical protein IMZ48_32980 [Candidatus Bathyarchaeota archaeon]|nr:hypothetical protein [Candidatus Bathyarchaeota archaeon]
MLHPVASRSTGLSALVPRQIDWTGLAACASPPPRLPSRTSPVLSGIPTKKESPTPPYAGVLPRRTDQPWAHQARRPTQSPLNSRHAAHLPRGTSAALLSLTHKASFHPSTPRMGGNAFTGGPDGLFTPRMPPEVYHEVKARLHRVLRDLYICVASPIEGPAMADHGDIDIVTWDRQKILGLHPPSAALDGNPRCHEIGRALGAERTIWNESIMTGHFAIPWPSHLEHLGPQNEDGGKRHIQVDVNICDSLREFNWALFHHAHGDLWIILNTEIQRWGLTVDEKGMYIHIPDACTIDNTKAKVKVTDDPVQVLKTLGLETGRFWEEPFASRDELYEYAATTPMFWMGPLEEGVEATVGEKDKTPPKSNERKRLKRPCYRGWVEDFLPRCRRENRFTKRKPSRYSVRKLVLSRFPIREEYEAARRDLRIGGRQKTSGRTRPRASWMGWGSRTVKGARLTAGAWSRR